ncbi:L-serine ammonia-lyase [Niveibacterium terrae]|uniref:L-serine ammonia-lyase n=1 Tax=Niveibacterium terrae TaxID=3373598 RepID=UPI003A8E42EC
MQPVHLSTFDLFRVGLGPSSSHTVGPMRAAQAFAEHLLDAGLLSRAARVEVDLHGSLGLTGRGHATDRGVMLGLCGELPETVDPDRAAALIDEIARSGRLALAGRHAIAFEAGRAIRFLPAPLPAHPNALTLRAFDRDGGLLEARTVYSIGGGFITSDPSQGGGIERSGPALPFSSGDALLEQCRASGLSIASVMRANERAWRDEDEIESSLMHIWRVMQDCVARGLVATTPLPVSGIARRAPRLFASLSESGATPSDLLEQMDWINLYAMAVNEENAAGGRVVTAPTNGAAGVIPAVLHYYARFVRGASEKGIADFLLTAAAIGTIYKLNASISGAEVGCQGEVGVACSMAAAGLAAVLGGSPEQVEHAAEIGMEHNLGLTCDPVGGLVQIPCIERNAVAAVKAVNAARMALRGDGGHRVSLDAVIRAMRETGAEMQTKYKETSLGGLALSVRLC